MGRLHLQLSSAGSDGYRREKQYIFSWQQGRKKVNFVAERASPLRL
jgi:hypothetical protein